MFLSLAKLIEGAGGKREQALLIHPVQLSRWLDEAWSGVGSVPALPVGSVSAGAPFLGSDFIVGTLGLPIQTPPAFLAPSGIVVPGTSSWVNELGPQGATGVGLFWHHLIYAYLIESTGVFPIFFEVVRRLVRGESLGTLSADGTRWLRATEELFFRDPPLFSISGVVSDARPHAEVNRRNAYWRMFGLDLPHQPRDPGGPGRDWKEHVGSAANTDFRVKWAELLRQVWIGLENTVNTSGSNPTDASYVAFLCKALADMFNNRRRGGLLAREEFVFVTVLSWFHLTLQEDTPIVVDLKAEATSPADRLSLIAQRVGMAPAARSRELFEMAEPASSLLRAIELGLFSDSVTATALFAGGTPLGEEMRDMINFWQSSTGERVKDRPAVTVDGGSSQPLRLPTPSGMPSGMSSNGTRAAAAVTNGRPAEVR